MKIFKGASYADLTVKVLAGVGLAHLIFGNSDPSYDDGYNQGLIDAYRDYAMEVMECGNREDQVRLLEQDYMEVQQSFGLDESGQLAELWANLETGTWTFTLTQTYQDITGNVVNNMCFSSVGTDWSKTGDKALKLGPQL